MAFNSPLQAVAATVNMETEVTVVNIFNSKIREINEHILTDKFHQLPEPIILTDFIRYLEYWGTSSKDRRGNQVYSFIEKQQLYLMDDTRHTKTTGTSKSVNDLTTVSPSMQPILLSNDFRYPSR